MERDEMMIAYCGVDCSACSDYSDGKCPGCRLTEWKEDKICLPVACCRKRGIVSCGECTSFPCVDMREFYMESDSHKRAYMRMLAVHNKSAASRGRWL